MVNSWKESTEMETNIFRVKWKLLDLDESANLDIDEERTY
jgi:hypothetical protein